MNKQMETTQWVRLGDYIEIVNSRNVNNFDYPIYGINKDKTFMHTVANTTDLDKSKYSLLTKGLFVFSGMQTGRDVCIRIALYENDSPVLISPAYTLFKLKDEEIVLSEYFFMFFNRIEMDRYGWFLSDSSIRSNLDWERFCDIKIPCPSIEVQRELVAAYNGLKSLAEENEAMLEPLAAACQAFVADCKEKYPAVALGDYITVKSKINVDGSNYPFMGININKEFMPTSATTNGLDRKKYNVVEKNMFVFSGMQTGRDIAIRIALYSGVKPILVSPAYTTFELREDKKESLLPEFLFLQFSRKESDRLGWFYSDSSVRSNLDWERFCEMKVVVPPIEIQKSIVSLYRCYDECKKIATEAREQLKTICPALIQRAAKGVKMYRGQEYNMNLIAESDAYYKVAEP